MMLSGLLGADGVARAASAEAACAAQATVCCAQATRHSAAARTTVAMFAPTVRHPAHELVAIPSDQAAHVVVPTARVALLRAHE